MLEWEQTIVEYETSHKELYGQYVDGIYYIVFQKKSLYKYLK